MRFLIWMGTAALLLSAQTLLDVGRQTKNFDASGQSFTKPVKTGTALPGACGVGEFFFKTDAAAGQNLHLCTAVNTWTQVQGAGGGGGGSATMAAQLGDLRTTRTSSTLMTVGASCSVSTPCVVRFGSRAVSIQAGSSVTVGGTGTGTVWVYVDATASALIAGYETGLTVGCSGGGCVAVSGATGFPWDSIPIARLQVQGGQFPLEGEFDARGWHSTKLVTAGFGLAVTDVVGTTIVSADSTVLGARVAVPGSAGAACSVGQWAANTTHFHVCVAENTWRRVAVSSW